MANLTVWGFRSSADRETQNFFLAIMLGTASTVQQLDALIASGDKKFYGYVDYFDEQGNKIHLYDQAVKLLTEDESVLVAAANTPEEYFTGHLRDE